MSLLWTRLLLAVTTFPTIHGWLITALLFLIVAAFSVYYGTRSGFLTRTASLPRFQYVRVWLTAWFMPALVEEVLFRVLLLPHPWEEVSPVTLGIAVLVALIVFVLGHPLRTWIKPTAQNAVFTDVRFLVLATLLGASCTAAYLATGSLWTPVVLHHTLVVAWLVYFGGWQKITPRASPL